MDAGLAQFRSDDTLALRDRWPAVGRVGRSGRELRHSFLLRSVEPSAQGSVSPWSIRQAAAYHAFDVETGRSVWVTIKGDGLLQKRIMEDSAELPVHRGAIGPDVGAAFDASLATHLIFFDWCEGDWRWFVRHMDERVRTLLVDAKTLPIDGHQRVPDPDPDPNLNLHLNPAVPDVSAKRDILASIKELGWPLAAPFGLGRASLPPRAFSSSPWRDRHVRKGCRC